MSAGQIKQAWCFAGSSVVMLLLLTLALYQQTVFYLVDLWNQLGEGEYGHGYLVLAISGYLVLNNRHRLFVLMPCPEFKAVFAIVVASMLWIIAALVYVEMLQAVALWLLVLAIVWTMLGNQVIRVMAFPILFIGFAIPVWFPLSTVLQNLTADSVFWVIRLLSVPALRLENTIVLPAGTLSIEEACSGLRYLLAALTLSTLYAYLDYSTFRSRLLVVLISASAAVLVNLVRVFIVVYLGYTTDMQHPLIHNHLALGWYLFGGLVVVLLVIDALLHRPHLSSSNGGRELPVITHVSCDKSKTQFTASALVVALLIASGPALIFWVNSQPQTDSYSVQVELTSATVKWLGENVNQDDWTPLYRGAIEHKMIFRDKKNREIYLYLGMYPVQRQGEELINDLNRISNEKIWHTRYQRERLYTVNGHQVLEQLLEKNDGTQRLVWYWYRVAGRDIVDKYQAKAWQVLGLMTGKPWSFVVAVAAQTGDDVDSTRQVLNDFILEIEKPMKKEMERIAARQ